jgi:hypothetical protein
VQLVGSFCVSELLTSLRRNEIMYADNSEFVYVFRWLA